MKRGRQLLILVLTRPRLTLGSAVLVLLLSGLLIAGMDSASPKVQHPLSLISVMAGHQDADLRKRVELLANQYNADPIDAKHDRVWKAIPGLNGVKIDVEATLKQAKEQNGDRIPLVVKQIPPKVTLDDLGPLPIYRGNPQKKQMALMVNVAWGTEYLADMLSTFEKNDVQATFFLDGSWTKKNPDVAKEIIHRGHELGNHAYSHPDMAKLDSSSQLRQILRTNEVIQQATGTTPKLFAPPGGAFNTETVKLAHGQKMYTILWTIDTLDWRKPPASEIYRKVISRAENGALVLMHPTAPTSEALRSLLPSLKKMGYDLVTVSELIDQTRPFRSVQ
jgi:probable sporulation protein (polysaccharide deacetylase family)